MDEGKHCEFAIKIWLERGLYDSHQIVISNKKPSKPSGYKGDPPYSIAGWERGYSWDRFWGNCFVILGDMATVDGIQQLCHHYYLQNGSLGAHEAVNKLKRFLAI